MSSTNTISRLFGRLASHRFSPPIQRVINSAYAHAFDIDLREFKDLGQYDSLNALFTRELQIPRELGGGVISPCDGGIVLSGLVANDTALQIKGRFYNVPSLLSPPHTREEDANSGMYEGYSYTNIYLSPSNYHRFHMPRDSEILEVRHFHGTLLPVNKKSLLANEDLFVINERVVCVCKSGEEVWYFVAVGALNVGQIRLHALPILQTNTTTQTEPYVSYKLKDAFYKKGDELGYFMMGSTIVLFMRDVSFIDGDDSPVRFGQRIER